MLVICRTNQDTKTVISIEGSENAMCGPESASLGSENVIVGPEDLNLINKKHYV